MESQQKIEVLNDLISINLDRIAGYEKAIKETDNLDVDLNGVFESFIRDSNQYKNQLEAKVIDLGGTYIKETSVAGKIYRLWMDLKNEFTGSDRKSIIASCEYGEDVAQKAYKQALEDIDNEPELTGLVQSQKEALQKAHDLMKKYRDTDETISKTQTGQ